MVTLLRGNTIFMNYGTIELRCPFFDTEFLTIIQQTLQDEFLSDKGQWEKATCRCLSEVKLPDEILDQEKRAFQKGTNFKEYIEEIILE